MSVELLYVFQNEKKVFAAADHSYKQTLVVATRGGKTNSFAVFFRLGVTDSPQPHEIEQDVLKGDAHALRLTPNDAKENSPETYALTELRTTQDMEVFRSLYLNAFRLGEAYHSWKFDFSQDFNMTTHSKLFIPAN